MKFDMHCHTSNGSFDSRVDIEEYIELLRMEGFQGMLVTDHNTYNGYRAWEKIRRRTHKYDDFVVLKGVEYDTRDAGHILVIMPDDVNLKVLEVRGMPLRQLIYTVHAFGGILGPAHPYGAPYLSAMRCRRLKIQGDLLHAFDFVEAFNTCETKESNRQAKRLVDVYHKVGFGGSDSHRPQDVGLAFTEIDADVRCNSDLIYAVKTGKVVGFGGMEREKQKNVAVQRAMSVPFRMYNRSLWAAKAMSRRNNLKHLFQHGA
ncbi:CehA/McbA family metallohydrolase [Hominifimenecus sp. rT4P-3]|uniref:CehA/McbA family metallohydrolase n=1 Tax=Hominifimenecus sp. rT4P-3 TaxID=3242979 RepID=UPI003DA6CB53